jgi:predicted nucleic acid-binding protein
MLAYLDSSALVKRGVEERETTALNDFLDDSIERGAELVSSSLAVVEVSRALRSRLEEWGPTEVVRQIDAALAGLSEQALSDSVLSLARRLEPRGLRSLDAIHLTTAILLDVDVVVAYDDRLLAAAEEHGLRTASPGR